jgi:hypothetical protein
MLKKYFAVYTAILGLIIFVVNAFGNAYAWYYLYPNLDVIMHLAGGVFVGNIGLYVYYFMDVTTPHHRSIFAKIFIAVATAAIVSIGWEIFEFILDTNSNRIPALLFQLDMADTMSDLAIGISGGILAALLFNYIWKTK